VCVAALAWVALLRMPMPGMDMAEMAMPMVHAWTALDVALLFAMWAVMMVAMMTPSATPMVMTFHEVNQRRSASGRPSVPSTVFLLGYVVVWTAFSALATIAQWWLHERAALSSDMALVSPQAGGALLIAAGIFQWTPLKRTCLAHCRSPLSFVMAKWREGIVGAFRMGLHHGVYCVGCCWALMALLFVVGVMNLLWVAAIGGFVLFEKTLRVGDVAGRVVGIALGAAGAWMMLA
jgi:predicted metal-binding membrane protein